MEERISTLLKGTNILDLGTVTFASNQPNHVFLIKLLNNNETITILYDENHNFLDIYNESKSETVDNITEEQQIQIKQLLKNSRNNI